MKNVIVWSKENCPQCDKAKALLKLRNVEYEERMIGSEWTTGDLLAVVPGARSVPQILSNNVLLGGYAELVKRLG